MYWPLGTISLPILRLESEGAGTAASAAVVSLPLKLADA